MPPGPHPQNGIIATAAHTECAGSGGISGNSQTEPLPGGRTTPQHRPEVVSPMREVQILCSGICLQQGVAFPAGGVRWTSRTSGLARRGREGFQLMKTGEAAPDRAHALSKLDMGTTPSRVGQRRVCVCPAFIPSLSTLSSLSYSTLPAIMDLPFFSRELPTQIVGTFLEFCSLSLLPPSPQKAKE